MIRKIIYGFFTILLLLFMSGIIFIKTGVKIDKFENKFVKIEGFFLKLENNLILRVKDLQINKKELSDANPTPKTPAELREKNEKLIEYSKKFTLAMKFFEEINIQNLRIGEDKIEVLYHDDIFFIDTRYFRINAGLSQLSNGLKVSINEISLKDFNATLKGEASANFKSSIYDFNGTFASHEISGEISALNIGSNLNLEVSNAHATSLKRFMDELGALTGLNPHAKEWIYGLVVAQKYYIDTLKIAIDLDNPHADEKRIFARASAQDLNVSFASTVSPVIADCADITLENGTLDIAIGNPTFNGISLDGSGVKIKQIFSGEPIVALDLRTKENIGKDLIDILAFYGINEPVYVSKAEQIDARVLIDIDPVHESAAVDANVSLKNGEIMISKAKFKSSHASVHITEKSLNIKNSNLSNEIFNATADGTIDFTTRKAKFSGEIKSFNITAGDNEILKFSNVKDNLTLDFSGTAPILHSQFLGADMRFGDKIDINVAEIKDLINFSKTLKTIGITGGDAHISTADFSNFTITSKNLKFDFGLIEKNGRYYNSDSLNLKVAGSSLNGAMGNGKLSFSSGKTGTNITLKDLDIMIDTSVQTSEFNSGSNSARSKFNFSGTNSSVILTDMNKTIDLVSYSGSLSGKDMSLNAKFRQGDFKLIFKKSLFQIFAQNISGRELNQIIGSQSFDSGNFTLKASGIDPRNYRGEILVENTFLKDYIVYQKLLSFLNSVPSLLAFKTPDFNDRGFSVKNGKIYFRRSEDKIYLNAMQFEGTSADIAGNGEVNLKSGALNIDLELKYLKDASSIISKIPLLNQIILGEDKTISTIIEIRGTMSKPTYSTAVTTDVLKTPYNLIKNTLMLPFVIFKDEK
ncbi:MULTISPECIES: YhdP family protein [unclassified Campylobacter]|uniref:YhdP family protein n=1 Tax=unclassified Campylobacter TaxID=2593542 RepID=UPI0022E99D93|nr:MULTISPECIES: AsmA-like C-terminal domain-containing protein [unclassified Campylobacter]MDA3042629.1 AsmA-like C-terminal domain-containing protein [Campylobacter sp. JMF_09 ED2]MDA3044557.1 AsmA-like C-terminal domain-containing protein [Campylobacter sp. JMF_07 ED4]MDA3071534.1 AsmA-like C-terminal domain-containing protein [Campylobacter sp. VBCF_03 NA9]MDA3074402.1 AsmA-like C-terminal domain-containing protein [Campylobacter sp. JMF_05 ED3]